MQFQSTLVKPQVPNESDKYSWNLYRLFKHLEAESKKNPSIDHVVLFNQRSIIDAQMIVFDPSASLIRNQCLICKAYPEGQGYSGWRMGDVMLMGPNVKLESQHYAYLPKMEKDFLDITDWFWKEYLKSGRCIFDREHNGWWAGDKDRFTQINNHSRRCNWCGQYHTRQIEKIVKIERKEIWVA